MRILVTMPAGDLREDFFPPRLIERLESLGEVRWNESPGNLTEEELRERIDGVDVLVTGWASPPITDEVLSAAEDLRLVAHTGGSVASLVSGAVYDAAIPVVSANDPMADFTAEHALAAVLAKLRGIPALASRMSEGGYGAEGIEIQSLHGRSVGLVGLGTIGRKLLDHLAAFDVEVAVYDPYVEESDLPEEGFVGLADLETTLDSDVVSIHAARTPETVGMLGAEELARVPDGALLVNTARAEIVVEDALLAELRSGRLSAVLDVYHEEPLPEGHELRSLENVLLTPHVGGSQIRPPLTEAVIEEIERLEEGAELRHEIPREQWETMTR